MAESFVDKDKFVIGGETAKDGSRPIGGTYFHVRQDTDTLDEAWNVSIRGDINDVDYVEYQRNIDDEEEDYVTYDIDAYSTDGSCLLTGEMDEEDVREIFDGELSFIADEILSGDENGRIDDCQYQLAQGMGDDVIGAAKRLSNGGPSMYLLIDGEFISFGDHIQITSLPNMTVDKFVDMGNIRLGHNTIELIQPPTEQQIRALRRWVRMCDDTVYVDIAEPSGKMYPRVIKSFTEEPNYAINDLLRYFHVLDENTIIDKSESSSRLPSGLRVMLLDYADEIWAQAIHSQRLAEGRGNTYCLFNGEEIRIIFTLNEHVFRGQTKYAVLMAQEMMDNIEPDDKITVEVVSSVDVPSDGEVYNLDDNHYVEHPLNLRESTHLLRKYITKRFRQVNEEVVADGSADHNPYEKTWKMEREDLKNFLLKYGKTMTSRESGKVFKVYYDSVMSELIGHNYCICIQYDPLSMEEESSVVYVRALDKFTERMFQAQFDDRGRDNMRGTSDDTTYTYANYQS